MYLVGLKDYLKIYLRTGKPVDPHGFVRVHRSYMVTLRHIDSVRTNRICVGEALIPVGDTYAVGFAQVISDRLGS